MYRETVMYLKVKKYKMDIADCYKKSLNSNLVGEIFCNF